MPLPKPPLKLKSVAPFVNRASQVEKSNPVIAYWCCYWAVQIILSNNLHSGDAECTTYTTTLLDDLESRKEKLLPNDAVTDDMAAQAYIENFALKVFQNADNALQARKASKQTADSFLAAATFLELVKIFPDPDAEISSKIKFAKYQAARILKALNAGEDPNLPLPPPTTQDDEGNGGDSSGGGGDGGGGGNVETFPPVHSVGISPPKPFVEDTQDRDDFREGQTTQPPSPILAPQPSTSDRFPLHPAAFPSAYDAGYFPTVPLGPSLVPPSPSSSQAATPGGVISPYHQPQPTAPPVPQPEDTLRGTAEDDAMSLRSFTSNHTAPSVPHSIPPHNMPRPPSAASSIHQMPPPQQHQAYPPAFPNRGFGGAPASQNPTVYYATPSTSPFGPATPQHQPHQPMFQPQHQFQQPQHMPPPPPQPVVPVVVDEESITKAQKHAKWAISALNYDDIPTAVKELRAALKTLGAS